VPYVKTGSNPRHVWQQLVDSSVAGKQVSFQRLRFGEFLADNIVRFINLLTYLLTYSKGTKSQLCDTYFQSVG